MKRLLLVSAIAALALFAPAPTATAVPAHASATCSDYPNQAAAQQAADTIDADGDGVYCESLPCPCAGPGTSPPTSPVPPTTSPPPDPIVDEPPPRRRAQTIRAKVTKVIDGDTIKVRPLERTRRSRYTVRVIGIDTPETKRPGVAVECGGPESSASMKRLAPVGSRVLLRTDPTQSTFDRYRRLLAYVQRKGRDLGRMQISRGHAKVYVFGGKPFSRRAAYRRSQVGARAGGRGVWSRCNGNFHSES